MQQTRSSPTPLVTHARPAAIDPWAWLGASLLLLAALLLALLLWRTQPPSESSPEVTFARDMIAHHQQAVEMSLILRDRTTDEALGRFALDILLTQQGQAGQMQGW